MNSRKITNHDFSQDPAQAQSFFKAKIAKPPVPVIGISLALNAPGFVP
jgi:hypothetical protein